LAAWIVFDGDMHFDWAAVEETSLYKDGHGVK
jgi:hypothetical protein